MLIAQSIKLQLYKAHIHFANMLLEIIFFRDFRYKIETTHDLHTHPLEIPPAYLDVIASVIQDRSVIKKWKITFIDIVDSDESLYALTSRVNDLLSPYGRDESCK